MKPTTNQKAPEKKQQREHNLLFKTIQMSKNICKEACGLFPNQLLELSKLITRSEVVIFEFFMICRQGISQNFAGVINSKSQQAISHIFANVLDFLYEKFVLGKEAFTREAIISKHTPEMFKKIWPAVRGAIDGTYFYVEKSEDFDTQKNLQWSEKEKPCEVYGSSITKWENI